MAFNRPIRSIRRCASLTVGTLMLLALIGCHAKKSISAENVDEDSNSNPIQAKKNDLIDEHKTEVRYPRRLLFIQISQYTSLNPVGSIELGKPDQTKASALHLAQGLKVPTQKDNQLYLLSDTAPPPDSKLPTLDAVVGAYEKFFETSKAQDRIIVYFGGHAIEVDGKAYLAPLEGNRNNPKTLIPLQDFYSKLKACRATQKVVVWDVCRFDPDLKRPRPGSELMTASLLKSLTTAPEGVEVVVTCKAGERAMELTNLQIEPGSPRYSGSAFLEATKFIVEKNRMIGVAQTPSDPIPVAEWVAATGKRAAEVTASHDVGLKQTVSYFGNKGGKVDVPSEPKLPTLTKNAAAEIQGIVDEFRIPPVKSNKSTTVLAEHPFQDDVIAAYKSDASIEEIRKDKQKYEFRNVTLNAFQTIRDVWAVKPKGGGLQQRDSLAVPVSNDVKKAVKKELDAWGIGIAKLEVLVLDLDKVSAQKKSEPRRWQANYDYARAIVKYRLAYMNEYDKLMGDVLTETLPPLDKSLNQNSYKLVSSEKMKSKKDIQKIAEEAQEALDAVIAEYKDTPWAIQAKYEKSVPLGLLWQPSK